MNHKAYSVVVPDLDGVSTERWRRYIKEAVGSWKGGFDAEDPLFALKRTDVLVIPNSPKENQVNSADRDFIEKVMLAAMTGILSGDGGANLPINQVIRTAYTIAKDTLEYRRVNGLTPGVFIED